MTNNKLLLALSVVSCAALVGCQPELTYPITDTGQDVCSDSDGLEMTCPEMGEEFAGQDAQFEGIAFDFIDNDDGTILDNVTGLMWQKSPVNAGMSYDEAISYCDDLVLAEMDDWRLPTTKEMFSASDFSVGWPYVNTEYFDLAAWSEVTDRIEIGLEEIVNDAAPAEGDEVIDGAPSGIDIEIPEGGEETVEAESGEVSKDEQFWTDAYVGVTVEGGEVAAFGVNQATGHIKAYAATVTGQFGNYARCVRTDNVYAYGVNDFIDNRNGTVTDRATGLMWAKDDSGFGMDWQAALAYANSSMLGGHTDWRLPNIKELQSIVDYSKSPSAYEEENVGPSIDTDFFNITPLEDGTTNTENDYPYFWSSTSAYFGGDSLEYYYAWYVAFGTAVDDNGNDYHGAGGMRFDTKVEGGPLGEGGERYYNHVRLVRNL